MKPKKFKKPAVIKYKIHSQENCTFLIPIESFQDFRRYGRLIPELSKRDVILKRPDLVKHLLFQNFKKIHILRE